MPAIVLREDYQVPAFNELRWGYWEKGGNHRAQVLYLPTGAGKTVVSAAVVEAAAKRGKKCGFLVDRVNLVNQTSAVFDSFGIPHGVIQAGHWRYRPNEPIQICSQQTLEARGFFEDWDLVVQDECHVQRKMVVEFLRKHKKTKWLGLSATPLAKGLGHADGYTNIVSVTTTNKLIDAGHLIPLQTYIAVSPDMTGAKTIAGEWSADEVEKRGMAIVGDIVEEYINKTNLHFGGPVKTIVFAPSVDYGFELAKRFQARDLNFQQLSYKDKSSDAQQAIIDDFKRPDTDIHGLIACEILTKGFDVPDVRCGIDARPYRKSLMAQIQKLGRVMRPADKVAAPGEYALWLDHSGNTMRFLSAIEDIFERGVTSLKDGELEPKAMPEPDEEKIGRKCSACDFLLRITDTRCPKCGHERERRHMIEEKAGTMIMVGKHLVPAVGKYDFLTDQRAVWQQIAAIARERKGTNNEAAQAFAQAQFRNIYGRASPWGVAQTKPAEPHAKLRSLILSNLIRYAKGKAKGDSHRRTR